MDLDLLIKRLEECKNEGIKNVYTLRVCNGDNYFLNKENILGVSYDWEDNAVILIPEYF